MSAGPARKTVSNEVYAARVSSAVPHVRNGHAEAAPHVWNDLSGYFRHLVEVHAAPKWLWPAPVAGLCAGIVGRDPATVRPEAARAPSAISSKQGRRCWSPATAGSTASRSS